MEQIKTSGIVLSEMPIGEYDKRLVLLTKDLGRISAFARGARRAASPLLAGSQPLVMAEFGLHPARDSYSVNEIRIIRYFGAEMKDFDKLLLADYFLEVADYFGRENEEASAMLNLLFVAFGALTNEKIPDELARYVFEERMLSINGLCPDFSSCVRCANRSFLKTFDFARNGMLCRDCADTAKSPCAVDDAALYALRYCFSAPLEKLFTFNLSKDSFECFKHIAGGCFERSVDREFKTLRLFK